MLIRRLPVTIPTEVLTATKGSSSAKPTSPRTDTSSGARFCGGWFGARGRGGKGGAAAAADGAEGGKVGAGAAEEGAWIYGLGGVESGEV